MSSRRAIRGRAGVGRPEQAGGYPAELASRVHPFWDSPEVIRAKYGHLLPNTSHVGRRNYLTVLTAWAIANGFESSTYPGAADFHALKRAGVIGESPSLLRAEGRVSRRA